MEVNYTYNLFDKLTSLKTSAETNLISFPAADLYSQNKKA